jgi:DNA polymerase
LHAEILVIQPRVIVCLGATAAQALLGKEFRITRDRGRFFPRNGDTAIMATYHPSAILRAPDEADRDRIRREFIEDLSLVAEHATAPVDDRKRPKRSSIR